MDKPTEPPGASPKQTSCRHALIGGLWIGTGGMALFAGKMAQGFGLDVVTGTGIWLVGLTAVSIYLGTKDYS